MKSHSTTNTIQRAFFTKNTLRKVLYFAFLVLIFIILLLLNVNTPKIGDDYVYSFIFSTNERITSISEIFESQTIHYNIWGGRIVIHSILQYLIFLNKPFLVNSLNSFVFIIYILVLQWHIIGKFKYNLSLTFIVFSLIFMLQPAFGETILWLTGSLNYLWGTTIILTFLIPYRFYTNKSSNLIIRILKNFIITIIGFIAGAISENLSLAMIVISILFIMYYKQNKWTIPSWSILGLISAISGYYILISAPGNYARAAEAGPTTLFHIIYRFLNYSKDFVYYLGMLNLIVAISVLLCRNKNILFQEKLKPTIIIYYIGILIGIYSMLVSPSFPPRAWFGIISINIIIAGIIYNEINKILNIEFNSIKASICLFCFLFVSFNIYDAFNDTNHIKEIWKDRNFKIEESIVPNKSNLKFEQYKAKTKFGMSDALYATEYMSKYYNKKIEIK